MYLVKLTTFFLSVYLTDNSVKEYLLGRFIPVDIEIKRLSQMLQNH